MARTQAQCLAAEFANVMLALSHIQADNEKLREENTALQQQIVTLNAKIPKDSDPKQTEG